MKILRSIYHRVKNSFTNGWLNKTTKHWGIKIALPVVMLLYFGLLDFFSELEWISNYKELHLKAFLVILFIELVARILDYCRERFEDGAIDKRRTVLTELLAAVSVIVQTKVTRFREALPKIENKSPFDVITQPSEQINAIAMKIEDFFKKVAEVPDDCFDVTIMRTTNGNNWSYLFCFQKNYSRIEPKNLMKTSVSSTAKLAFKSGNEHFFASKQEAAKCNSYHLGDRDNQKGDGSVYCKPVKIPMNGITESFIVTFTSYGTTLCDPRDTFSAEVWCMICREFARRIELELVLLCMKESKQRESVSRKDNSQDHRKRGK
jgi:hypothetical protein